MEQNKAKVSLFLMTQKGYEVLESLVSRDMQECISKVIIGNDKNVVADFAQEIMELCINQNIPYFFREQFVDDKEGGYLIAISWRWLIDTSNKLIVLHDSILPKYRGFAPLVNMLINGEPKIGVTALFAVDEYDKGPIIEQKTLEITYPITILDAIVKISKLYAVLTTSIVEKIKQGEELVGKVQDENEASYSLWRDAEDYLIDWTQDSRLICRFINALGYPYQGAQSFVNKSRVIIQEAIEVDDINIENRTAGKVIFLDKKGQPTIVCGKGLIKIIRAVYEHNSESVIPLKQFRIRFL
jgi:methionyl-tRNA formyltransferase